MKNKARKRAAIISLVVSVLLTFIKFAAFQITKSNAILSDALENIVNVLAGIATLFVIFYAAKPVDDDHPYGHGKIEYFSAVFEGGLISFAAAAIMLEAIRSIINGNQLYNLDQGIILVVFAGIVNLLLGLFLKYTGKKQSSLALEASGQHIISDFWTSVGVVLGVAVIYWTNIVWLDSVVAISMAVLLGYTGLKIMRKSVRGLMDEEDISVLKKLAHRFEKSLLPGIIQIHHVKVIRSGDYHHVDAHIVLPEFWDVITIHDIMNDFEKKVFKSYEADGEMNMHVDPCRRAYCEACDLSSCHLREKNFVKRLPIALADLRSKEEPKKFWVEP